MAVSADVLNGSGAGEARDFAESFDAGEATFAGVGDDVVPVFTAHDLNSSRLVRMAFFGLRRLGPSPRARRAHPRLARLRRPFRKPFLTNIQNSAHAINDDDAFETFVVAEGVGTVAENEGGKMVLGGKAIGIGNFFGAFDFDDIARSATEAHGGKT